MNEKEALEIGSLRCANYIEKKVKFDHSSLKSPNFVNHGSQHSSLFQKKSIAAPLELLAPKLMILWPYKKLLRTILEGSNCQNEDRTCQYYK